MTELSAPAALAVQLDCSRRRITAQGELDHANAGVLAAALTTLIDSGAGDCTVDVSRVTFIDSGGLHCLVDFAEQFTALGGNLSLTGATPRLRRVLSIVGLCGLLVSA